MTKFLFLIFSTRILFNFINFFLRKHMILKLLSSMSVSSVNTKLA